MADAPQTAGAPSIARSIDISAVRAQHSESDVRALAMHARDGRFVNAHVLPHWVPLLRDLLAGSDSLVGAPVGFPGGGHATAIKVAEARRLVDDGVQELDVVSNIGRLRSGDDAYVGRELDDVRATVPADVPLKVVLETSLLTADEITRGAMLALRCGADYVKTGTGWTDVPVDIATIENIADAVNGAIAIKASGGLRDLDTVLTMQRMGVERFGIGVDAAVAILSEERRRRATAQEGCES